MKINRLQLFKNGAGIPLKKTKITSTIGPSSDNVEVIEGLLRAGMNICRINFSHDSHEIHFKKLQRIKEAIRKNPQFVNTAIMLDTKGPEIRTGILADKKLDLKRGQRIRLTSDYSQKATADLLPLSYDGLYKSVSVGSRILIADGNLVLKVVEKDSKSQTVIAEAMNPFLLGERKNVNLPGIKVDMPVIAEKDRLDLVEWGLKHDVDMVALSFTRSVKCIQMCRDVLGEKGKHIKIIPKIENQEGVENIDSIMEVSDGLMIARGDLGMEMEPEKLFVAQKLLVQSARAHARPVIMATQMIESMVSNPRPTRAEISDIGNAVVDMVDCTMTSGETGNGAYPIESVQLMANINREVEAHMDYEAEFNRQMSDPSSPYHKLSELAVAAVRLSFSSKSPAIICLSKCDWYVNCLATLRPSSFIFYPHSDARKLRGLQATFGVLPVQVDEKTFSDPASSIGAVKAYIRTVGASALLDQPIVLINADLGTISVIKP